MFFCKPDIVLLPIFEALKNHDLPKVNKLLAQKGTDVNALMCPGEGEKSTDPDILKKCRFTPLMFAVTLNFEKAVDALLEAGADVHRTCSDDCAATHYAAGVGSSSILKKLIDRGVNVNAMNKYGETPLYRAAEKNALDAAVLLVKNGADLNPPAVSFSLFGQTRVEAKTPLRVALSRGYFDMAAFLIDHGADIQCVDRYGRTPLGDNASGVLSSLDFELPRRFSAVKLLIEKRANLNEQDENGRSILFNLVRWERASHMSQKQKLYTRKLIRLFLENGADPNLPDNDGNTPLTVTSSVPIKEVLLRYGAVAPSCANLKDRIIKRNQASEILAIIAQTALPPKRVRKASQERKIDCQRTRA